MSVRNSGGNNGWLSSNDAPSAGSVCGLGVIDVDTNTYSALFSLDSNASFTTGGSSMGILTDADGTTIKFWTGSAYVGSFAPGIGNPFFYGIVWNGTSFTWYWRLLSTNTLSSASGTFAASPTNRYRKFFGNDYGNAWNGRCWNIKAWSRQLTAKELLVESFYRRVMYPASVDFHWHMLNAADQLDYSGNNYTPTVVGTLTDGSERDLWVPRRQIIADIISGLTPVSHIQDINWNLLEEISRTQNINWNILQYVSRTQDLDWNTLAFVSLVQDIDWDIIQSASRTQDIRWNLLELVSRAQNVDWNVIAYSQRTQDINWNILSALSTVSRTQDINWNILETISRQQDINWNLLSSIARSFDINWNTLESVGMTQEMRWNIIQSISRLQDVDWNVFENVSLTQDIDWNSGGSANRTITMQWRITGTEIILPLEIIAIPAEGRIIAISEEGRIIKIKPKGAN